MGQRLTTRWTDTLEEAYGEPGRRGTLGELFVVDTIRGWGWGCTHHESPRDKQIAGIDIEFRKPDWARSYTADVKTNIDRYGSFYVETNSNDWLFNRGKTSDRIWHCNPDTGWMAWYSRALMQRYICSIGKFNTGLHKIKVSDKIDFITRRKA